MLGKGRILKRDKAKSLASPQGSMYAHVVCKSMKEKPTACEGLSIETCTFLTTSCLGGKKGPNL